MIFLVLWIALFVIFGFYTKKDKNVYRISLLLLTILFALNHGNADYLNYTRDYADFALMDWKDSEPLWALLMHVFSKFGFPFEVFKAVIFLIGMFLINKTVSAITKNRNVVLVLYFVYPFIIDVTQLRNFFAMTILVYALHFLAENSKWNLVKYSLLIFAASLVHNIFIVYLIFLTVKLIDFKKAVALSSILFSGILISFKTLPSLVLRFFSNYHNGVHNVAKYVNKSTVSPIMIVALAFFYIAAVIGAIWINKEYTAAEKNKICTTETLQGVQIYLKCIILISLSFVLNIYSMDFARVMRNIIIIEYALMVSAIYDLDNKKKDIQIVALLIFVLYSGLLFECYPYSDTVVYPLFQNNYLFEIFSIS